MNSNATDCIHFHPCMRALKTAKNQTGKYINLVCSSEGYCNCYQKKNNTTVQQEKQQRKEEYSDYIQSPYFQNLKMQIMKRDGFQCQKCHTAKNLLIHHVYYGERYNENPNDLITLCQKCHDEVHEHDKENTEDITREKNTKEQNHGY